MDQIGFQQLAIDIVVSQPLYALVEERQTLIPVGHKTPLLDKPNKHLRPHQQLEELVVVLVPRFQELVELEQSLGIGGTNGRRFRDRQEVRAVTLQGHGHELQERLLDLQLLEELKLKLLSSRRICLNNLRSTSFLRLFNSASKSPAEQLSFTGGALLKLLYMRSSVDFNVLAGFFGSSLMVRCCLCCSHTLRKII